MEIISTALYLFLKYFVLFFTACYFAGKGLQDLSPSNVWEWVLYRLSGVGQLIYRVVTRVYFFLTSLVCRKDPRSSTLVILGNMVVVAATIVGIVQASGMVQNAIFGMADVSLELEDFAGKETLLSNTAGFVTLVSWYIEDGQLGFFGAVGATIMCLFKYTLFYIVSYSVLFGFMEPYMKELHVVSQALGTPDDSIPEEPEEVYALSQLPHRCVKCLFDWLDNFAVLSHLGYVEVLGPVIILVFAISGIIVFRQEGVGFSYLFSYLWGEAGLADSVTSFLIVLVFQSLWQFLICFLLPRFFSSWRKVLYRLDLFAQDDIRRVRSNREEWASAHDLLFGSWEGLHELHLH